MYKKKTSYDFFYLFRDIMRCGSFQRAARELDCTAASISKKMTQMEKDLGFELFEKDSGGMVPTAAGLFLYDRLDSVLWNIDAIVQEARNIPPESSMKLNIGISETFPGKAYRQLIQTFSKAHPDIAFSLSAPSWREMSRRLIDGKMDIALTYSLGFSGEPRLERKPLVTSGACIYYHEQLPVVNPDAVDIFSFKDCAFVCLDTDVAAMNMLKELPFDPQRVIFVESLKTLFLYVNAGLACTVLGPFQQLMETKGIRSFALTDMEYAMGIDLVWEKSNANPAISMLIDCAEKILPSIVSENSDVEPG